MTQVASVLLHPIDSTYSAFNTCGEFCGRTVQSISNSFNSACNTLNNAINRVKNFVQQYWKYTLITAAICAAAQQSPHIAGVAFLSSSAWYIISNFDGNAPEGRSVWAAITDPATAYEAKYIFFSLAACTIPLVCGAAAGVIIGQFLTYEMMEARHVPIDDSVSGRSGAEDTIEIDATT